MVKLNPYRYRNGDFYKLTWLLNNFEKGSLYMKKILIISLSIVLMLGLVACGKNAEGDESINKEEPVETHHPDAHHSGDHH